MQPYILKVINVEDSKLNFFPIKNNGNCYPRVYNHRGGDSGTVLPDDGCLWGTGLPGKGIVRINTTPIRKYSILPYL